MKKRKKEKKLFIYFFFSFIVRIYYFSLGNISIIVPHMDSISNYSNDQDMDPDQDQDQRTKSEDFSQLQKAAEEQRKEIEAEIKQNPLVGSKIPSKL